MKTTKTLIAVLALTTLAACGKAPLPSISDINAEQNSNSIPQTPEQTVQAEEPPVVTPPANPTEPTILKFNYYAVTVCDALKTWNPVTTTIQMDASNGLYYSFTAAGVSLIVRSTGETNSKVTATIKKSTISALVCTIKIGDGQFVSVQ